MRLDWQYDLYNEEIQTATALGVTSVPAVWNNIELLRRKKRLEFILAEDEELLIAAAATMEVIKNRWVH